MTIPVAYIDRDGGILLDDRHVEIDIRIVIGENELLRGLRPHSHVLLFLFLQRVRQVIGEQDGNSHDKHGYYQNDCSDLTITHISQAWLITHRQRQRNR